MATEAAVTADSASVRERLIEALQLDLVGPDAGLGDEREILPRMPSRWYLTGYLVPWGSEAMAASAGALRGDDDAAEAEGGEEADGDEAEVDETVDEPGLPGGLDDATTPEPVSAQPRHLPSSMGLTVLAPAAARQVEVTVSWGDYHRKEIPAADGRTRRRWKRTPRRETLTVALDPGAKAEGDSQELPVARSGLVLAVVQRPAAAPGLAPDTRAVSIFLVNRRRPAPKDRRDEACAFQAALEAKCDAGWAARPDPRAMASDDWDDRVADLQYRDLGEYAVGHNAATAATVEDGVCRLVRTAWLPQGEVEQVQPRDLPGVELGMDALAQLADAAAARQAMTPLIGEYRDWIAAQRQALPAEARRRETADQLLRDAAQAADRIEKGLNLLQDAQVLTAFRLANRAMAAAARQRQAAAGEAPTAPRWRPFQLAFLLMNLPSLAQPDAAEREIVDLLFFPTGGGKTEAYLGLAAFALVLRRLRHPGPGGAGLTVLMRYTLRLLTLDQLGRAAALVCALELEREKDRSQLGDWPFEIGLWVGSAATPNYMGRKGDRQENTARELTRQFKNDSKHHPAPIPLENCPWCGTKFDRDSFCLFPNPDCPTDLHVRCANFHCAFSRDRHLPIVAVDEPLYRRLPGFVIATVDKFAALPWRGEVGKLLGRVDRYDPEGFYGPCEPNPGQPLPGGMLPPPDLIIQDELHLISGPLGTMAGLYETALDALCRRDGAPRGPKIVASTATVRRAETQIRALFNRRMTAVFPPPGPDRRDNFFARTAPAAETAPRLYLGVPAQGRGPKVAMLRVYLALLAAGERWYQALGRKGEPNPADPYMTVVGYFNSLRELGGARRLIEDEIRERLKAYGKRKREGESVGLFADRRIKASPTELTSRVSTADVAEAKRLLALPFADKAAVDVAIATNMISVGIDVQRLGTMVVFGQPKTSAEYIQASSRIGRDPQRPGLVVTILNVNKPRDRSHYERFGHYHRTFYRAIEASSATPFSPRALDRGLAAALVGLARHKRGELTPPLGAAAMVELRADEDAAAVFAQRAREHADMESADADRLARLTGDRASSLLDCWAWVAENLQKDGVRLQYSKEIGAASQLLQDYLSDAVQGLPPASWQMRFRAPRSLRDVEPAVKLWVQTLAGSDPPPESA